MIQKTIEGVVTEVTETGYVLFCDDGSFRNISLSEGDRPAIGERKMHTSKSSFSPMKYASVITAAAVFLFVFLIQGVEQNQAELHFVATIDINPSIEIHLTEELKVIDLVPLNEKGMDVTKESGSEGQNIYQMIDRIVSESISKGYLSRNEDAYIETTIVKMSNHDHTLSIADLKKGIQDQLINNNIAATVLLFQETKDFYEKSSHLGLSINKYRHFQKLQNRGLVSDVKDVEDKSITQLQRMLAEDEKENRKENGKQDDDQKKRLNPNPESNEGNTRRIEDSKDDRSEKQFAPEDKGKADKNVKPGNTNNTSTSQDASSSNQKSPEKKNSPEKDQTEEHAEREIEQSNSKNDSQQNQSENNQDVKTNEQEGSKESADSKTEDTDKKESSTSDDPTPQNSNVEASAKNEDEHKPAQNNTKDERSKSSEND